VTVNVKNRDGGEWQLVTTEVELLDLKSEWERLYVQNPLHSPFLAWGWTMAWLKHLAGPHELRIAVWKDDIGLTQLIIPFIAVKKPGVFSRLKIMLACGYGREASDYLGCLRLPQHDGRLPELFAAAVEKLLDENSRIELTSLDSRAGLPGDLEERMRAAGRPTRRLLQDVCVAVNLPGSWDEYLLRLSGNYRSQVRRRYRNAEGDERLTIRSIDVQGAKEFTEHLIRLNRQRINQLGRSSSLEDIRIRNFLLEAVPYMAARGIAWLDTLEQDGRTIAVALNFVHGNSAFYYLGGFDASAAAVSPGMVLFSHVIQRCIEKNINVYDFLRGQEDYKYKWGAQDIPMYKLDIYACGLVRGRLSLAVDLGISQVRKGARRILRR
jgi:CelD/BcsL family acetyltransferase involved in cellulose biosynthesis